MNSWYRSNTVSRREVSLDESPKIYSSALAIAGGRDRWVIFRAFCFLVVGERRQGQVAIGILWAALRHPNPAAKSAPEREEAGESCGSESAGKGRIG